MALQPKLWFYDNVNPNSPVTQVDFRASDGSAIKAGDTSGVKVINIWNNPLSTQVNAAVPPDGPGGTATFGQNGDGVSDALSVDITVRDNGGGDGSTATLGNGGDLVQGLWTKCQVSNVATPAYVPIGFDPVNGIKVAQVGTIQNHNSVLTQFTVTPPSNAQPGLRNFKIRVSYSFQ